MPGVLVDSNVLLDVLTEDPEWFGEKRSPPPDFYIGAHAAVSGLSLLTRDPGCTGRTSRSCA